MTNFKIFNPESRLIWLQEGIAECEEPGCAEGLGEAWSARVDADTPVWAWVGPWQYQSASWVHGWVVPLPYPP